MTGERVVAYLRVSTLAQAEEGASLAAQRRAIEDEVERRGGTLIAQYEDTASGRSTKGRPGLTEALAVLESGEATALVVAKLDRLSRSLLDFATLMSKAQHEGWSLVALDLGIDTTTPQGELMASVLATFAQFERRLIGQRTKDGLAEKRAQGVQLGRPRELNADVVDQIIFLHEAGMSLHGIARRLEAEDVPTARGGRWSAATVRAVLASRGRLRPAAPRLSPRRLVRERAAR